MKTGGKVVFGRTLAYGAKRRGIALAHVKDATRDAADLERRSRETPQLRTFVYPADDFYVVWERGPENEIVVIGVHPKLAA
jgi:hypothetical protein